VRDVKPVPALPYLAPWYRVVAERGKVVLEYGQRIVCLEGGAAERLLPALLPFLDGTRTVEEIVAALGEPARPAVEHVLQVLMEHGLLEVGPPLPADLPRPAAGAAELLASLRPGAQPMSDTASAVESCSVAIVGRGGVGLEVARLLRSTGVKVAWADEVTGGVDLTVCAPAPPELPRLPEWNKQALDCRQPWLQVLPFDGRYAAIGPLYLPGDTGCFECFRLRRAANLGAPDEQAQLEAAPAAYASAPALDALVGGLAAQVSLHWLVLGDHYAPAAFYAFEPLPTLSLTLHHVHRVPRCDACSGVNDVAQPLPWFKEVPLAGVG
jgi:bacteriocin biosynthesis cyclodehydratase domain-containing protein